MNRSLLFLLSGILLCRCAASIGPLDGQGDSSSMTPDAATTDSGTPDVFAIDNGPPDAVGIDGGTPDASPDVVLDASTTDVVPDASGAMPGDVVFRGADFGAYEGRHVYVLLEDGTTTGGTIRDGVVSGGRVEFLYEMAACTRCFGYGFTVWVDADGDGHCTSTDPVWFAWSGLQDAAAVVFVNFSAQEMTGGRSCPPFP